MPGDGETDLFAIGQRDSILAKITVGGRGVIGFAFVSIENEAFSLAGRRKARRTRGEFEKIAFPNKRRSTREDCISWLMKVGKGSNASCAPLNS